MHDHSNSTFKFLLAAASTALFSISAWGQIASLGPAPSAVESSSAIGLEPRFDVSALPPGTFGEDAADPVVTWHSDHRGYIAEKVKRGLEDQKQLYLAPFKPSNIKWDALVLGGTAGLLIADRHIENNLPGGHRTLEHASANIAIAGISGVLTGMWIYGIKGDHPRPRELGNLELETLVNTFLVYLPMQYIGARQRPGEGNGHGDFLRHSAMNTSFPGGHAMFTWAMVTVAVHEYPKPWVRVLSYSAALAVTAGRFLGRDHWASDMFVGSALGIGIGTHIFNSRCDPDLTESCKRHAEKFKVRSKSKVEYPAWRKTDESAGYSSGRPISQ